MIDTARAVLLPQGGRAFSHPLDAEWCLNNGRELAELFLVLCGVPDPRRT